MRIASVLLLILFGASCAVMPARAAESYANCTGFITSLPKSINASGTWCLKQNLSVALAKGPAVRINVNDVVLDCNDFQIKNTAGASNAGTGIVAISRFHEAVRHCKVQGFNRGIDFEGIGVGIGRHVIEDNEFAGNTDKGIRIEGDGSIVRRNRIFDTGPSGSPPMGIYATGIMVISDNTISTVFPSSTMEPIDATGIEVSTTSGSGGSIDHNRIRDVQPFAGETNRGIQLLTNTNVFTIFTFVGNDVLGASASGNGQGLVCATQQGLVPTAVASQNIVAGFTASNIGCADGGQNDFSHP